MAAVGQRGSGQDAVEFLVDEHAAVDQLFVRYEQMESTADPTMRRDLVDRIIGQLRLHAAMEEQAFYPSVAEVLAEDPSIVEESLQEHAKAKADLATLEETDAHEPAFDVMVQHLIQDVRHHVNEEEHEVLPKLRAAVGEGWLIELGDALRRTKASLATEPMDEAGHEVESASPVLTREGPLGRRRTRGPEAERRRSRTERAPNEVSPRSRAASRRGPARSSASDGRVTYHVKPADDGRWHVKREGATRSSRVYDRKTDAVASGKNFARKHRRGRLVVHKTDGKIQQEFTYGDDPRRTKG